jgi:hypothetical protein
MGAPTPETEDQHKHRLFPVLPLIILAAAAAETVLFFPALAALAPETAPTLETETQGRQIEAAVVAAVVLLEV